MYLNVPVLLASLAALATTASADWMDVSMICVFGICQYAGRMSSQPWLFLFFPVTATAVSLVVIVFPDT